MIYPEYKLVWQIVFWICIGLALISALAWTYVVFRRKPVAVGVPTSRRSRAMRQERVVEKHVPQETASPLRDMNMQAAFNYVKDEHFCDIADDDIDRRSAIFDAFRQAARDGTLTIWGRPDSTHLAINQWFKPLEKIPPEHWRLMGLEYTRYMFGDEKTVRQTTTDPDNPHRADNPASYLDLMVSRAELVKLWPPKKSERGTKTRRSPVGGTERIPIREFWEEAPKYGWQFTQESLDILELCHGIKQACLDGEIEMWGRPDRNLFPSLTRDELLVKIPPEHWKDYKINVGVFRNPAAVDLDYKSYSLRVPEADRQGYADLHVAKGSALRWLKTSAAKYRGKMKRTT